MKEIYFLGLLFGIMVVLCGCSPKVLPLDKTSIQAEPIIADHTSIDLQRIPLTYIAKAKSEFGISYGHTSHGSQIVSGMEELQYNDDRFSFDFAGSDKVLKLFDREPRGDLGNPNREDWSRRTRDLLDERGEYINIVMWSWCGQVSGALEADIDLYLNLMQELENDYSGVVFIYMTGHLDGSGETGNLHQRNEQIRAFCRANNKVLYDFADIERYDPDGNDFLSRNADDGCNYIDNGINKNWAKDWCDRNPEECNEYRCAHSESLNCDQKAAAFWWLVSRIAGWSGD